MCASVSGVLPANLVVKLSTNLTRYFLYKTVGPGNIPVFVSSHVISAAQPRFPYGLAAEPD